MKLVSSADTLDFLGKSAPRPWIKRMLRWMIFDGEITPYFTAGRIVPRASVGLVLVEEGIDLSAPMAERDEAIRQRWNAEYSPRLVGRNFDELVEDDPVEWSQSDEPHAVGAGFFVFAEDIDWEGGKLYTEVSDQSSTDLQHLFWDADEHLVSMFAKAEFAASLSGMCFRLDNIEMLQPGAELDAAKGAPQAPSKGRIGRPRTWDWEGALTYLVGIAQHPDGLPTGAGAQAKIEKLIADWFISMTGNSPAPSQIRAWAQKIMGALKSPEIWFQT